MKVCKFGGTSLSDANQFRKVKKIIFDDHDRKYVVVSAPGKRYPSDIKVTDLFLKWHGENGIEGETSGQIITRFGQIISELGIDLNINEIIDIIGSRLKAGASLDYAASRGEWINAQVMAKFLNWTFVDPEQHIILDDNGNYKSDTLHLVLKPHSVIPGFYGSSEGGVKTFPRGGSDITGAIVASAVGAILYENWTDVSGVLAADPHIVTSPKVINLITYRELRELSFNGASVFHPSAVIPAEEVGIPINIRNTNQPDNAGTIITNIINIDPSGGVTGIVGKNDRIVITVEKTGMNEEIGFAAEMLAVFKARSLSVDHISTGTDVMSVVCEKISEPNSLVRELNDVLRPTQINIRDLAVIATVGRNMVNQPGIAASIFHSLSKSGINIQFISQGASELTIVIGVDPKDYVLAIQAIYQNQVR